MLKVKMTLRRGGVLTRDVMKSADPAHVPASTVQCSYIIQYIVSTEYHVLLPPTFIAGPLRGQSSLKMKTVVKSKFSPLLLLDYNCNYGGLCDVLIRMSLRGVRGS